MLQQVIRIVKAASRHMTGEGFTVENKDGESNIVTSADLAVQRELYGELLALLPSSGFLGEEDDCNERREYTWVVDPIDGTMNFARGLRESAISVALAHGEELVLGVVYNPFKDELYCAERGKGAFCNGQPIRVSQASFEQGLLCTAMCLYKKEYAALCNAVIMDAYAECNDVRRFGAASLELCYLAAGRCDLYFELRLFPWDHAAASVVLTEAGGVFCSLGGERVRIDKPTLVVAANNADNLLRLRAHVERHVKQIPYGEEL